MSYSQHDEEKYICEAAGPDPGVLLDIGAFNGKTFSNSLALIERGWEAVLVEPSLKAFGDLLSLHGANDRVDLVQALVGTTRELIPFWSSDDAVSTSDAGNYRIWKDATKFSAPYYLPQITIADLFDQFRILAEASVVSIDTEGTSGMLFHSFPFEICRPRVICVEFDGAPEEIEAFAAAQGYVSKYRSDENFVFVRETAG